MKRFLLVSLVSTLLLIGGCSRSERPFLIAQVCLHNEGEVDRFVALMRKVAQSNGLEFVDTSSRSQEGLSRIDSAQARIEARRRAVNIGTLGGRGFGFGAGNLGLPGYQVAIGFTAGDNAQEAHKFAAETVRLLRLSWHVETQSGETGVHGMASCK